MYDVNVCSYFNQISIHNREQSYIIGSYHLHLAQNNTWETVNVGAFCIQMHNNTLEYKSWLKTINFSEKLGNFYFIFYMLSLMMIQSGWNMYMENTTHLLIQSPFLTCPSSIYLKTWSFRDQLCIVRALKCRIMLTVVFSQILRVLLLVCIEEWCKTCSDLCRNLTLLDSISTYKPKTDHLRGGGHIFYIIFKIENL